MKKDFDGKENSAGIYTITNLLNGKIYIGSTKCFKTRANTHENRLRIGKNCNKHLLASWNKYGKDAFIFEVVEVTEGNIRQRRMLEQKYIKQYYNNWNMCYNLVKNTIIKSGPWSNTPEETKKKMSTAAIAHWKDPIIRKKLISGIKKATSKKSYKENLRKATTENWNDPNIRKKRVDALREVSAKTYHLVSPDGIKTKVKNLQQFCKTNNFSQRCMRHIIAGTKISYRGWRLENGRRDPRFGTYVLIGPYGNEIIITNLRKFCRENNIKYERLQSVIYGRQKSCQGYSLPQQKLVTHKGWKFNKPS